MTKNWRKKLQLKICLKFFFIKNCNLLIPMSPWRPSYMRSLHPSKENVQHLNMKFLHFFLFLWIIFAPWIQIRIPNPVPEIIDKVFAKTSQKRSFSMTEYERFGHVFTKTWVYKFVHEFIDPVFAKTSPKRSFSSTENDPFGLVFVNTGSINSGTDLLTWLNPDPVPKHWKIQFTEESIN